MKAKKALKRLTKIEALMAEVAKRYSAIAPGIRKVLQEAKTAVTQARVAVSSGPPKSAKKTEPAWTDAAVRKAARKVFKAKKAKRRAPAKKAAKTSRASGQVAAKAANPPGVS